MSANLTTFLSLLNNLSIFIVLIVGYSFLIDRLERYAPTIRQGALGVLFGLVAIGSMHIKIPVAEGVIVDQRNAIVVLSGAFGGPVTAIVAAIMAGSFRAYLGGAGVLAGCFGLMLSAIAGTAIHAVRKGDEGVVKTAAAAIFAVIFTLPGFLLFGDFEQGWNLMVRMAWPWGSAIFVGLFLGGLMLAREDRRRRAEQQHLLSERLFRNLFDSVRIAVWDVDYSGVDIALEDLRKAGVRNLREHLEERSGLVFELGSKIRMRHVNRATLKLYNVESEAFFLENYSKIVGPDRVEMLTNLFCAFWDNTDEFVVETTHRAFDGRKLSVIISLPIPKTRKERESVPVSVVDMTEYRRAAEDRDIALQEARRANLAKSEFLAAMSHELRTPLNAILGFSDILANEYFGPMGSRQYVDYSKDIHASGALLLEMVNDLLDISTIEAGKKSLLFESISLDEVIRESLSFVSPKAFDSGIELTSDLSGCPDRLVADRRALQQILLNLLSNAIKYTERGGKVSIFVETDTAGVSILVRDTGIGIPNDRLEEILSPFVRGEKDPHKAHDGWGLGLAIANSLIEMHDGRIEIQSTEGAGTKVTVTLPHRTA
jgi:signal transduction histidine kinase